MHLDEAGRGWGLLMTRGLEQMGEVSIRLYLLASQWSESVCVAGGEGGDYICQYYLFFSCLHLYLFKLVYRQESGQNFSRK